MNLAVDLTGVKDLAALFGPEDRHLKALREAFGVRLSVRRDTLSLAGAQAAVQGAAAALEGMRRTLKAEGRLTPGQVQSLIAQVRGPDRGKDGVSPASAPPAPSASRAAGVTARSPGQSRYLDTMRRHDLAFCTGPAGTGKTFLAVAAALEGLRAGSFRRIVLARPAVEAGEKLGFLPGDLQEKVNPYLRPLLDALGSLLEPEEVHRLVHRNVVEIIPLAFMRGRTLERSFAILDEAQNCSIRQMLMFLTRLGADSKAVVVGDTTQTDLPDGEPSGLKHAWETLEGVPGIGFVALEQADVVRHPLVRRIVEAYDKRGHRS